MKSFFRRHVQTARSTGSKRANSNFQIPRQFERLEAREMLSVSGDFNGDGFDDLAVGAPGATVAGHISAGAVHVIYGSSAKLDPVGSQRWTLNSASIHGVAKLSLAETRS